MDIETLSKANKLKEERNKIASELDIWERELTSPAKLGYLQGWNKNNPPELESNISKELFEGFRRSAINELKLRILVIDEEFDKL